MPRLLNIDLHISVIAEVKNIFERLHKSTVQIDDWSLSGHSWVMNRTSQNLDIINSSTWRNMDTTVIDAFLDRYDTILKQYDGFICCYPVSFVLLFERYNKPIYIINAVRYDMPFCWNNRHDMIQKLHDCLMNLQRKNLLVFISNNKADDDYIKYGLPELKTEIIPSLCLYTNMHWDPTNVNGRFLDYTGSLPSGLNEKIVSRQNIGHFTWDSLMRFKGIIHFPYEASTMSIFEHISSEIPLFFPTQRFLKELWSTGAIRNQMNYWIHNSQTIIPNYLLPTENLDYWIDRADYYGLEGYYYFDSYNQLFSLLQNFEDDELYEIRKEFNKKRIQSALDKYADCFASI